MHAHHMQIHTHTQTHTHKHTHAHVHSHIHTQTHTHTHTHVNTHMHNAHISIHAHVYRPCHSANLQPARSLLDAQTLRHFTRTLFLKSRLRFLERRREQKPCLSAICREHSGAIHNTDKAETRKGVGGRDKQQEMRKLSWVLLWVHL